MLTLKPISSMEKCFLDEDINSKEEISCVEELKGEEISFEIAYTSDCTEDFPRKERYLKWESPIKDYITVRQIEQVPVRIPTYMDSDDYYLRKEPGLYPDLLLPLNQENMLFVTCGQLKSLFVTVNLPADYPAGEYPISFTVKDNDGNVLAVTEITVRQINATLPEQEMSVTQWFHCDCIANYYNVEVFSEEHWEYIRNFIITATKNGINTILTPVFTPPLDTAVGYERRTVQLVDVTETENGWKFGLEKLERWVKMCIECGVKHLEISHLYSQWGASKAPKIMGFDKNGEYRRLFGWETDAASDEYREFLRAFLTAFLAKMKELNADKMCYFHISDEPGMNVIESYKKAKDQIADLLEGYRIMDALSNYEFYELGILKHPIPSTSHIEPFLEAKAPDLWAYYCCGQHYKVSNRFISMPQERTRVIGMQFWKYDIKGFLQWGYNFYNSQGSIRPIDPYAINDGESWVPAGDTFSVYPGPDGKPYESLRIKAFTMALQDTRALALAEALTSREKVLEIIEGAGEITFSEYPHEKGWLEKVRRRINKLIEENSIH